MSPTHPVKPQQRSAWARVAGAWKRWSAAHQRATRPVTEAVLDAAGLERGMRVLDVACGVGDPALEIARRIGPEGRLVAIDLSAEMLALARDAAQAEGLANVELVLADGDAPPRAPFHAITCRFGLMFFPDPVATVRAWRAVAAPGGRVVSAVWTGPDENPYSAIRPRVAREVLGVELAQAGPMFLALAIPGAIEGVLAAGGLSAVTVRKVAMRWEAEDAGTLVTMMSELNPPFASALEEAGPEKAALALEALARAVGPFSDDKGHVSVPGCAWVAAGTA